MMSLKQTCLCLARFFGSIVGSMDQKALVSSFNKFAVEFCNELESKTSVCSPVSAEIGLAIIALGSRNQTHEELLRVLDFTNDEAIRSTFSFLRSKLESMEEALQVATKIYLKKGDYDLQSGVKTDAKEVFGAALEQIDFGQAAEAANEINTWVAGRTKDKIKNIIKPGEISEDMQMLLLNAIYFKGAWEKPFKQPTREGDFHVNEQTVIQVPMMRTKEHFRNGYAESLKAQLLELSYTTAGTSLVIVLPDEVEGLKEVLQKLVAGHDLTADLESLVNNEINVAIPKFKVESTINLKQVLSKLGIKAIFGNSADINLLTSDEKLFVSDAIQVAFIDVNEEGTEAGAVTKFALMKKKGCHRQFIADKPFLYILIGHGIPFFIGTYYGNA